VLFHERLYVLGGGPLLSTYLVAANMEESIREQTREFADQTVQKFVDLFLGRVERRVKDSPLPFDLVRSRLDPQLGIRR